MSYRFGGKNEIGTESTHFSDTWEIELLNYVEYRCSKLQCTGDAPDGRSGHAAAVVNGIMYIFGGRNELGEYLGDLSALNIETRCWYTFQDIGMAPSPRSGLCMSCHGSKIYVVGGESYLDPRREEEMSMIYTLDTSKLEFLSEEPSRPLYKSAFKPNLLSAIDEA